MDLSAPAPAPPASSPQKRDRSHSHEDCLPSSKHHHRHRVDDDAPRNHGDKRHREGKSSKHKHKHHKHKHRRKHRKDHGDGASNDDAGSDKGEFASGTLPESLPEQSIEFVRNNDENFQNVTAAEENQVIGNCGGERAQDAGKLVARLETNPDEPVCSNPEKLNEDEKEEGEILDEEFIASRIVESDVESGEIEADGLQHSEADGKFVKSAQEEQSTELLQRQRNGKALPALESMLGIAEAYDSGPASDENKLDRRRTGEDDSKRNMKKRQSRSPESHSSKRQNCQSTSDEKNIFTGFEETSLKDASPRVSSYISICDNADGVKGHRKKRCSPDNRMEERPIRISQSPSQDEKSHGNHNASIYRDKIGAAVTVTEKSDQQVDQKMKDEKSINRESMADDNHTQTRSKDNNYENDVSLDRSDAAYGESREAAYDRRHLKDSPDRSGRQRRSRETDNDYRKRKEESRERQSRSKERRSRSKERHPRSKERRSRSKDRRARSKEPSYWSRSKDNFGRSDGYRRSRSRDSDRKDRKKRSTSREAINDSRYGRNVWEGNERSRRSRSRDVLHESRYSERKETGNDSKDRDRYERRHSSREYTGRRRSASRSRRQSLDRRRRSRSRGRGDSADRRRHSRSKERTRTGQTSGIDQHRNATDQQRERVREGIRDSATERMDSKSSEHLDVYFREEEDEENHESGKSLLDDEDVERIKEESRKRRQAILEKYRNREQPSEDQKEYEGKDMINDAGPAGSDSVADVKLLDENMSVASDDSKDTPFDLGKRPLPIDALDRHANTKGLGEGTPKSDKSNDMFCDYIFGESPAGGRKLVRGDGAALETSGLTDNWDDAEGYYCYRIGEVLDGRYEVAASHGRGVFSSVVRARDTKASQKEHEEVAIKIIRNNEVMFKYGQQELIILKKLAGADLVNRRHCVRFLSSFEYRNHLCLVFESLYKNLREILKMFGRNIGIKLTAVQSYAKQLFIALKHLRNCGVLHCDIKPDNMLVNEAKTVLKLCDFGSAMFHGANEITPYLVSRFYRAPEIILGLPYDYPLDMWSVGCCLYEFFTGKVLFPGPTNNDMLKLHMELKGPFPKKMLKKALFASKHFDQDFNFCAVEEDPVTKTNIKRVLVNVKQRDIGSLLSGPVTADEDVKMLGNFKDLLEKIFMLDPEKRLTVYQALSHPFITGK